MSGDQIKEPEESSQTGENDGRATEDIRGIIGKDAQTAKDRSEDAPPKDTPAGATGDTGGAEGQEDAMRETFAKLFGENAADSFTALTKAVMGDDPSHPSYQFMQNAMGLLGSLGGVVDNLEQVKRGAESEKTQGSGTAAGGSENVQGHMADVEAGGSELARRVREGGHVMAFMDPNGSEYYINQTTNEGMVKDPDGVERPLRDVELNEEGNYVAVVERPGGRLETVAVPSDPEMYHRREGHPDWTD